MINAEGTAARRRARGYEIDRSLRAAVGYLCRRCGPTGRFDYLYDCRTDEIRQSYNLLRHAGTTMELCRLVGSAFDEGDLRPTAERSWAYLQTFVVGCERGGVQCACLVEEGIAKLGGTALALMALTERGRTGQASDSDRALSTRLAAYLGSQQRESGEFICKAHFASGEEIPFKSAYYPGESILALCAAFRMTGESTYLERAVRGIHFLLSPHSDEAPDGSQFSDHWIMKSIAELDVLSPGPEWGQHMRRLSIPLVESAQAHPGSWLADAPTAAIATRLECLCAALTIELRHGDRAHALALVNVILAGLAVCYERQVGNDGAPFRSNSNAHGGFVRSLLHSTVRIDYVQHVIGASIGLIEQLFIPDFRSLRDTLPRLSTSATRVARNMRTLVVQVEKLAELGMDWSPARQTIYDHSETFINQGVTKTDPSHDLAHLLARASGSPHWLPRGTPDEVRLAEYDAVFVETLLDKSWNSVTLRRVEAKTLLAQTLAHLRWFVDEHFAPFPLPAEEAYRRFCWRVDAEVIVRLSPFFFLQKRAERACADYRQRTWKVYFNTTDSPPAEGHVSDGQTFVRDLLFDITARRSWQ
jgi:hypothetical protein